MYSRSTCRLCSPRSSKLSTLFSWNDNDETAMRQQAAGAKLNRGHNFHQLSVFLMPSWLLTGSVADCLSNRTSSKQYAHFTVQCFSYKRSQLCMFNIVHSLWDATSIVRILQTWQPPISAKITDQNSYCVQSTHLAALCSQSLKPTTSYCSAAAFTPINHWAPLDSPPGLHSLLWFDWYELLNQQQQRI